MGRRGYRQQLAALSAAAERGECTCVERALLDGAVAEAGDPVPVDPDCEQHAHLLAVEGGGGRAP